MDVSSAVMLIQNNVVDDHYKERMSKRHQEEFPSKEEISELLEQATTDVENYHNEYNTLMAEITVKKEKLRPLTEEVRKAEAARAAVMSDIQLSQNMADRAYKLMNVSARAKEKYEIDLATYSTNKPKRTVEGVTTIAPVHVVSEYDPMERN